MKKVVTKKRPKLSKNFKCPFCANQDTVECKMDFKAGIGSLSCRLCSAAFQMPIHHLHEPVDVFSEWLDECEAAQNPPPAQYADDDDDDDDDDLPASSGLATKKPAASANYADDIVDVGDSDDDDDDE
jgi:transcription elongation factor Elf1